MDHVADEYTGPAVVTMCGAEVAAQVALQVWEAAPDAVDEAGRVVHSLDPETSPYWTGTLTITPDPDQSPVELPADGHLTLRLSDGATVPAEVEAIEWTEDERLVVALVGRGPALF